MRKKIHDQLPLAQPYIAHVHAKELEAMDQILSEMSSVLDTIQRELARGRSSRLGREESVRPVEPIHVRPGDGMVF